MSMFQLGFEVVQGLTSIILGDNFGRALVTPLPQLYLTEIALYP